MAYNKKSVKSVKSKKSKKAKKSIDVVPSKKLEKVLETEPEELVEEDEDKEIASKRSTIEEILFKIPNVKNPMVGTPKIVQEELDKMAIKIQKNPNSKSSRKIFNRIHLYMHGYLINIVLRQFPYIKGMQTSDIYQQTLIALWQKAIPGFRTDKGMSFLNFAKMCIRRHLITALNTSKTIQKHQPINQSISLDSQPSNSDEDSNNTYSNIIPDDEDPADVKLAEKEAYTVTRDALLNVLSDFEKTVLNEYLTSSTYKEIAKDISRGKGRCIPKSVDNALLRIRKKALELKNHGKIEDLPIFIV